MGTQFFNGREWHWNIPNNAQGMLQKTPEGRVRSLTKAEAQRLIQEAEKHTRSPLLVYFIRRACNTGCRKGDPAMPNVNKVRKSEQVLLSGFHQGQKQYASHKVRMYGCNLHLLKIID